MITIEYGTYKLIKKIRRDEKIFIRVCNDEIVETDEKKANIIVYKRKGSYYCSFLANKIIVNNIQYEDTGAIIVSEGINVKGFKYELDIYTEKKINIKNVVLPFGTPEYCTYPKFTAMQGILKGYDKEKNWLYNNYIQLWADKFIVSPEYWFDFKYENEADEDNFANCIIQKERGDYKDERNIISIIKEYIENKIYFFPSVDMLYIDKWWEGKKERWHHVHQTIVFGYNDEEEILHIADFFNGKYQRTTVSYEQFEKAFFENSKGTSNQEGKFSKDVLLKYTNKEEKINISKISNDIKEFIECSDTRSYNFLNICKQGMVYYGMDALEEIKKYLYNCMFDNKKIDIRPIQIIYEFNAIMEERMRYLKFKELIELNENDVVLLKRCKIVSQIVRNLVIKLNSYQDVSYADILEKYAELMILDEKMLHKIYYVLTGEKCEKKYKNHEESYTSLSDIKYDEIVQKLKPFKKLKEYRTFKYHDIAIFPYLDELQGKFGRGQVVDNAFDDNTISYWINKYSSISALQMICDDFFPYKTKLLVIYEYKENYVIRYGFCNNHISGIKECVFTDIIKYDSGIPVLFTRLERGNKKIIGKFDVYNKKICLCKYEIIRTEEVVKKYTDRYIYSGKNVKQVIREYDNNERESIYPLYGEKNIDFYQFKHELIEEVKKVFYESPKRLKEIRLDICTNRIKVMIIYEDNSKQIILKSIFNGYVLDSYFNKKIEMVSYEIAKELYESGRLLEKEKEEGWKIIIEKEGKFIKEYTCPQDSEMKYFMSR